MEDLGFLKSFSLLTKYAAGVLQNQLADLEIERYFSPFLIIADHNGHLTSNQLAEKLKTSKPIVSRIVQHLTSIGYVERRLCDNDRRCSYLHITKKGESNVATIKEAFKTMNQKCVSGMSDKEKKSFQLLLQQAIENLQSTEHNDINFDYS